MRVAVELQDQPRVGRALARDVVETEVVARWLRAEVGRRAATVRMQHDQDVLRVPDAQLARRLAWVAFERRADLTRDRRTCRILDIDDHHAGVVGVVVLAVGPAADVRVVAVNGQGGIHPAVDQRLVATSVNAPGVCARAAGASAIRPTIAAMAHSLVLLTMLAPFVPAHFPTMGRNVNRGVRVRPRRRRERKRTPRPWQPAAAPGRQEEPTRSVRAFSNDWTPPRPPEGKEASATRGFHPPPGQRVFSDQLSESRAPVGPASYR